MNISEHGGSFGGSGGARLIHKTAFNGGLTSMSPVMPTSTVENPGPLAVVPSAVKISPNGKYALIMYSAAYGHRTRQIFKRVGNGWTKTDEIFTSSENSADGDWVSDNEIVYTSGKRVIVHPFNPTTGKVIGSGVAIHNDPDHVSISRASRSGRHIVIRATGFQLLIYTKIGSSWVRTLQRQATDYGYIPAFTPDSKFLFIGRKDGGFYQFNLTDTSATYSKAHPPFYIPGESNTFKQIEFIDFDKRNNGLFAAYGTAFMVLHFDGVSTISTRAVYNHGTSNTSVTSGEGDISWQPNGGLISVAFRYYGIHTQNALLEYNAATNALLIVSNTGTGYGAGTDWSPDGNSFLLAKKSGGTTGFILNGAKGEVIGVREDNEIKLLSKQSLTGNGTSVEVNGQIYSLQRR